MSIAELETVPTLGPPTMIAVYDDKAYDVEVAGSAARPPKPRGSRHVRGVTNGPAPHPVLRGVRHDVDRRTWMVSTG
jgi:hypothetical protein